MIVLSSSVSWPSSSMRTCLPQATARSRTTRGNLLQIVADRLHARLHDADLQLGRQQVEPLHGAQERRVLLGGAELHDLVAGQDELADQVHELVEQADVHADGAVGDGGRARLGRLVDADAPQSATKEAEPRQPRCAASVACAHRSASRANDRRLSAAGLAGGDG